MAGIGIKTNQDKDFQIRPDSFAPFRRVVEESYIFVVNNHFDVEKQLAMINAGLEAGTTQITIREKTSDGQVSVRRVKNP